MPQVPCLATQGQYNMPSKAQLMQELASANERIKSLETELRGYKIGLARAQALPPSPPASPQPAQASSPQARYFESLTQEQKDQCIKLNICFRCRQHGHSSSHIQCHNNDWRARSREPAATTPAPTPSETA
ncbi:unnamed protein product [Zymoseptoria tritici ST99CH_1A5]|uniref:Uncharacterized protein n=2 Tax=Zymoseptoria tritici TaxID=1047171 RepID=F9XRH7_ZYMTI|nr:uncharacterized protein MYCGRDRAFT_97827 [Zymoseptoria tritici IPO323]EGP82164.1 hypothetical protein MYCGRDRAFT_97827 [Zymoseptoria tritici IPO323]SMR64936.1 unnamed protein product [Zymoseptoria tritici ST99CH_3D1]SMY30332.1 unnamed protein product [Zymoseptoria tritici ST99CH_1A5]